MLLCLAILLTRLCFSEGVTSAEIFDLFDENVELERPAVEDYMFRREIARIKNATACLGNTCIKNFIQNGNNPPSNMTKKSLVSTNNTYMMPTETEGNESPQKLNDREITNGTEFPKACLEPTCIKNSIQNDKNPPSNITKQEQPFGSTNESNDTYINMMPNETEGNKPLQSGGREEISNGTQFPKACLGNTECIKRSVQNDQKPQDDITVRSFGTTDTTFIMPNETEGSRQSGGIEEILNGTTFPQACLGNTECVKRSVHNDQIPPSNIRDIINNPFVVPKEGNNILQKSGGRGELSSETDFFEDISLPALPKLPSFTIKPVPLSCPEDEIPANIGPYEVPTQRDMVLHVRNHLLAMYRGFHAKAMFFLKDVKEATHAAWSRKMLCSNPTDLMHYRRCVRWVGGLSVLTTKSLVTALETARHYISTLMQGKICNISAIGVDPIHLIRILAAEKVSLEFALPDFLRQLDACSRHCPGIRLKLPHEYSNNAHLTDKDFVIRHYLTQQNFNQQLKQKYKI
ncbi:uncharacterized protein LOC125237861 [Leguminivora glycinivorella]|uniref:uncharacterized protein LOC125237861 n=1 Tax=Leguminivora glycinivorella TaxID=1035111 RepID=UPI00200D2401|nr:uncharacterized protein LOC125237861 [Leguminivora glycinivorella]